MKCNRQRQTWNVCKIWLNPIGGKQTNAPNKCGVYWYESLMQVVSKCFCTGKNWMELENQFIRKPKRSQKKLRQIVNMLFSNYVLRNFDAFFVYPWCMLYLSGSFSCKWFQVTISNPFLLSYGWIFSLSKVKLHKKFEMQLFSDLVTCTEETLIENIFFCIV